MTSEVDICNRAGALIGAERISSISPPEDVEFAYICAEIYDDVRDTVLRSHPWNCAVKRVSIGKDVATPAYGYAFQYTLPSDNLRVLEMDSETPLDAWEVESGKILTDRDSPIAIRYIWRETDPNKYDSLLVMAIAARLALESVERVTQSNTKKADIAKIYDAALKDAKGVDAKEGSQVDLQEDPWITARV